LLYFTQFWFASVNGFSGQSLYERWTLAAYNVLFTFFPILVFGLLDQDVSKHMMYKHPELYLTGHSHHHFNAKKFWSWIVSAILHSAVIFFVTTEIFENGTISSDGTVSDLWSMGTTIYLIVLLTVSLKLALEARTWTWIFHLALWGSIALYFFWMLIYGLVGLIPIIYIGSDLL